MDPLHNVAEEVAAEHTNALRPFEQRMNSNGHPKGCQCVPLKAASDLISIQNGECSMQKESQTPRRLSRNDRGKELRFRCLGSERGTSRPAAASISTTRLSTRSRLSPTVAAAGR